MASRMPTRCYVHIAPQAQLSYWVWDQFPLSLCNLPLLVLRDIRLAVLLSGLRRIIFLSLFFFLSLPPSSLSPSVSSPFLLVRRFSHVLHQDHSSFLHLIAEFDRLSPFLSSSFSILFARARLSRLLSTACQHNAS